MQAKIKKVGKIGRKNLFSAYFNYWSWVIHFIQGPNLSFGIPNKNLIFWSDVDPPSIFYRKFPDYAQVITDIHDLFIETTDVGDLWSRSLTKSIILVFYKVKIRTFEWNEYLIINSIHILNYSYIIIKWKISSHKNLGRTNCTGLHRMWNLLVSQVIYTGRASLNPTLKGWQNVGERTALKPSYIQVVGHSKQQNNK